VSTNHNVNVHLPVVVVFKIQCSVVLADVHSQIRPLVQCASVISGDAPPLILLDQSQFRKIVL